MASERTARVTTSADILAVVNRRSAAENVEITETVPRGAQARIYAHDCGGGRGGRDQLIMYNDRRYSLARYSVNQETKTVEIAESFSEAMGLAVNPQFSPGRDRELEGCPLRGL